MNASRRICCNAANAFRPSSALQSVFLERNGTLSTRNTLCRVARQKSQKLTPARHASTAPATRTSKLGETDQLSSESKEVNKEWDSQSLEELAAVLDELATDGTSALDRVSDSRNKHGSSNESSPDAEKMDSKGTASMADVDQGSRPISLNEAFSSLKSRNILQAKAEAEHLPVHEYEGQYVHPIVRTKVVYQMMPWLFRDRPGPFAAKEDRYARLGVELRDFARYSRPDAISIAVKDAVLKEVKAHVQKALDGYEVEGFGSYHNGLATKTSDIDLRISKVKEPAETVPTWLPADHAALPPQYKTRKENLNSLKTLQEYFRGQPGYLLCNLRHARYPLLHMQHSPSGIDIQIVCANDTSRQRKWIAEHLERNPWIYDLFVALKATLELRGLTDVFRGGLGSYSLLVMVVSTLNWKVAKDGAGRRGPIDSEVHRIRENGYLFRSMLRIFAEHLNTYEKAVQVVPWALADKISLEGFERIPATEQMAFDELRIRDASQPYMLCLQDPNDPTNDLGRQAYGWKHIQATLRSLSEELNHRLHINDSPPREYLASFIGTAGLAYTPRLRKTVTYAREVLGMSIDKTLTEELDLLALPPAKLLVALGKRRQREKRLEIKRIKIVEGGETTLIGPSRLGTRHISLSPSSD